MNSMSVLFFLLFNFFGTSSASKDYLPRAKNVTWASHNFKTILRWGPKPFNYTHTVEFSKVGKDKQRNPHCIRSTETACDLTNELRDLKISYMADVLTEPLVSQGMDLVELPYTQSKKFCPYSDTVIGKPDFRIKINENKTIVIYIRDQLTALYKDGRHLTLRDIFKEHLKYKIIYSRARSTGKTEMIVDQNKVELNELDKGESYCFSVAAYIPSRRGRKETGKWSPPKCSPAKEGSLIEEYGLWTIGVGSLVVMSLLIIVIIIVVTCCKRVCGYKPGEEKQVVSHV
ncbi:coagulation factor IIIb [Electrophorus electricus]|uniref:Tissue factor n=1 Tax=Electrophorus electricus TaxID=8005 RepID=A0A4W4GCM5_ELEEL|nr:coagulation factor IIIb [Electrophorus electricus]